MRAVVALVMLTGVVTSCQVVKSGARCRTNELQHDGGAWIMKCEKGRWRRALTKADAARILAQLMPTSTTTPVPPATEPPTTAPPETAPPVTVPPTTPATTPPTTAPSYPSDLDPSFGSAGRRAHTITEPGYTLGYTSATVPTAAGLYVVQTTNQSALVVSRFTTNGDLDPSFAGDGSMVLPGAFTATADSAGRVYAAFTPDSTDTVRRYTASGALDPSFGGAGEVTYSNGATCGGYFTLTPLADGSVVGWHQSGDCPLRRFLPDGSNGPWGDLSAFASSTVGSVVSGPNGTVYVRSGASSSWGPGLKAVVRLTSSGAPDAGFGSGGVVALGSFDGTSYPSIMHVLSDGSMLFAHPSGMSFDNSTLSIRRVLPSGQLATTGGFAGGELTVNGYALTPLAAGGFLVTWWPGSTQGLHRSFTADGVASSAIAGQSGSGRLAFPGGAWAFSSTHTFGGRLMTVIDRQGGTLEFLKFLQAA